MFEALLGYAIAIIAFKIDTKKDIKLAKTLSRVTLFVMIMYDILVIVQFYLCDLYLFKIIEFDYKDYPDDYKSS